MTDVGFAGALGVLGGIVLTLGVLLAIRLARGSREFGTEADRAAYRALHHASRAAPHLRRRMTTPDAGRAARHLRMLLGSAAVAIVSAGDEVWADGEGDGLESSARRIAARVRTSGRRQVFPAAGGEGRREAVGAPIVVGGEVVAVVIAFAEPVRGALVRAIGEVAEWCAAQVELGDLDASRAQLAEAELRALRAQISPHFIYNALTAIASFIHVDPARARELVLEFADFTRYSFRRQGEFTTLAEELRSIHSYLELERARFGDRLRVTLRISPETLATVIPFLSVQPLVENAVRHGLEPGERGGGIRISSSDHATHTEIEIDDDGVGMDPEAARGLLSGERDDAGHVGLRNVDARLRQMYGPDGGLVVETNVGAGTLVRMRIPKSQPLHDPVVLNGEEGAG